MRSASFLFALYIHLRGFPPLGINAKHFLGRNSGKSLNMLSSSSNRILNYISVQNVTLWHATRHRLLILIIYGLLDSSNMDILFILSWCSSAGKYFLTFSISIKLMLFRISKCLGSNFPKRSTGHFSICDSLILNMAHVKVWFMQFHAFCQFTS